MRPHDLISVLIIVLLGALLVLGGSAIMEKRSIEALEAEMALLRTEIDSIPAEAGKEAASGIMAVMMFLTEMNNAVPEKAEPVIAEEKAETVTEETAVAEAPAESVFGKMDAELSIIDSLLAAVPEEDDTAPSDDEEGWIDVPVPNAAGETAEAEGESV